MPNDDLKKMREAKDVLFSGIKKILLQLDLGHLDIAGLELEPSSIKPDKSHGPDKHGDHIELFNEQIECPGGRRVLRLDPITGEWYWICIYDTHRKRSGK